MSTIVIDILFLTLVFSTADVLVTVAISLTEAAFPKRDVEVIVKDVLELETVTELELRLMISPTAAEPPPAAVTTRIKSSLSTELNVSLAPVVVNVTTPELEVVPTKDLRIVIDESVRKLFAVVFRVLIVSF